MPTISHLPRRSRSRVGRRPSITATIHKASGKLYGSPPKRTPMASPRRHSTSSKPDVELSPGEYTEESVDDLDVKKETRSLSPQPFSPSSNELHSPTLTHDGPLAYASLPASPITPSPPQSAPPVFQPYTPREVFQPPFSLWEYLREELLATDHDSHQELKWERVSNFLSIPFAIEKILIFGFTLCFDSFLHTFTILPIRFSLAVFRLATSIFRKSGLGLPSSQKADILRTLILFLSIAILIPLADPSKIYHSIRGQDTIKLYVIFNALEIADRLCSSIGQDILDCLFSRSTLLLLSTRRRISSHTLRPLFFFLLATLYTVAHALVLLYQLTSLNVAINSYDHTLLSLLISNQFVEIKGSVFKKFEKDNLFQITCADIVERFTLSLMLFAVALRNLIELSGSEFDFSEGIVLPKSFGWFKGGSLIWTIFYPVMTVVLSEVVVDWLKHAFITKFNHIRPSVYERFTDVLCLDLATGSAIGRRGARKHSYVDQSPLVARRLGFPALPLAVLVALIGSQSINLVMSSSSASMMLSPQILVRNIKWVALGVLFWACFVVVKIIIGVNLISYASRRRAGMEAREEQDRINDFGRDPIGEGKDERMYNRDLKALLDNKVDNAAPTTEIGERMSNDEYDGGHNKRRPKLEELTRFTMVKRIW